MTHDKLEGQAQKQGVLALAHTGAAAACAGGGGLLVQAIAAVFGFTLELEGLQAKLLELVNALFALLTILGVVADPTTAGVGDSRLALSYEEPKKN